MDPHSSSGHSQKLGLPQLYVMGSMFHLPLKNAFKKSCSAKRVGCHVARSWYIVLSSSRLGSNTKTPALKYALSGCSTLLRTVTLGVWKRAGSKASSALMLSRTAEKAGARNISSRFAKASVFGGSVGAEWHCTGSERRFCAERRRYSAEGSALEQAITCIKVHELAEVIKLPEPQLREVADELRVGEALKVGASKGLWQREPFDSPHLDVWFEAKAADILFGDGRGGADDQTVRARMQPERAGKRKDTLE
eukprot:6200691-Pleurochrysis_carterae.AAC.1